jgi:hypothetical protein
MSGPPDHPTTAEGERASLNHVDDPRQHPVTTIRAAFERVFVRGRTPRAATERLPLVLRSVGVEPAAARVDRLTGGGDATLTFAVRPDNGRRVIVRLAGSEPGIGGLQRAADAQRRLRGLDALGETRSIIPELLAAGDLDGWRYTVEAAQPGRPLADAGLGPAAADRGRLGAIAAARALHRAAPAARRPDEAREAWIDRRVPRARDLLAASSRGGTTAALDALLESARASLAADPAPVGGWIHGDLWAANVLVDDAGAVTGLVDWDSAADDEAGDLDPLHLVLFERRRRRHESLGESLVSAVRDGWDAPDRVLLAAADLPDPVVGDATRPDRGRLIRYWLWFLDANVARHRGLATDREWLDRNVAAVLACA